jgi:pimeloyl-ACP methyl ester carboxylesterase
MLPKENLVIVHSFPTNSILLKGYIDYLSDYYHVFFIDLPGFTKAVHPLDKVTMEGYRRFVETSIEQFNLADYFLEGISFGFSIVNRIHHHGKCKGMIAVEPYIGRKSLQMSPTKRILCLFGLQIVCSLKLYSPFWKSPLFSWLLPQLVHYPDETMRILFEQIDGKTFFETAKIILSDLSPYRFQDLPYVLLANKQDRAVNFEYIVNALTPSVKNLLVIPIEIDHYPKNTSKAYFQQMVPEQVFEQVAVFFSGNAGGTGESA